MDLVRELLLAIEGGHYAFVWGQVPIEGISERDWHAIEYHLRLLEDAQLVEPQGSTHSARRYRGLTWRGHEFVDTLRDPTIWERVKSGASSAGGVGISLLVEMGKAAIKAELQKRGYLPG